MKNTIELPKGYKLYPEGNNGTRFETPTSFGWAKSTDIALVEIRKEIRTGNPAWRTYFGKSKRALKRSPESE
jgi:hypothetical protein